MPVPGVIRAAWGSSSHYDHRLHFSVQSPHGPPHEAKGRATLKGCQQSSGNYKSNFPGIVQTKARPQNGSWKDSLQVRRIVVLSIFPSLPPWWGLPRFKNVPSLPILVVRLFSIYLKPSLSMGKEALVQFFQSISTHRNKIKSTYMKRIQFRHH